MIPSPYMQYLDITPKGVPTLTVNRSGMYQDLIDHRKAKRQDYYMRNALVWLVLCAVLGFGAVFYYSIPLIG